LSWSIFATKATSSFAVKVGAGVRIGVWVGTEEVEEAGMSVGDAGGVSITTVAEGMNTKDGISVLFAGKIEDALQPASIMHRTITSQQG